MPRFSPHVETRQANGIETKEEAPKQKKVTVRKEKTTEISKKKSKKGKGEQIKDESESSNQYAAAVNNLNKLKTEKLIEEIEMAKLKKQKMTGEIIPVAFTQNIFNIHFKNVSTAFYNAVDNYTAIIIERLGGNRADLSLFRLKLNEIINDAIKDAKVKSKQDLIALSKEYSESND